MLVDTVFPDSVCPEQPDAVLSSPHTCSADAEMETEWPAEAAGAC